MLYAKKIMELSNNFWLRGIILDQPFAYPHRRLVDEDLLAYPGNNFVVDKTITPVQKLVW